jgi:hypothetical protein
MSSNTVSIINLSQVRIIARQHKEDQLIGTNNFENIFGALPPSYSSAIDSNFKIIFLVLMIKKRT